MKSNIWFLLKVAASVFIISLVLMSADDYIQHALGMAWPRENSAIRSAVLALFAAFGAWLALWRSKQSAADDHQSTPNGRAGNSAATPKQRSPELEKKIAAVKAKIELLKSGGAPTFPAQGARMGSSSSDADSAGQSIGDALSQAVERLLKAAAAVDPQRPGTLNKNSEELSSAVERLLDAATPIDPQPLPALNKRIKALKARIEQLKNG